MRTAPPIIAPVFRSHGQARLLAELFLSAEQEFNIAELAERAEVSYPTAHREIVRLLEAGVLSERRVGNVRLISPDEDSPLAGPLRQLLLVSAGPVPLLAAALGTIPGVQCAFIFGSFAARLLGVRGQPPGDVDVMVIGQLDATAVYEACRKVGDRVSRPINPTIMRPEEWSAGSGFITHVTENAVVPVIGEVPWL